MNNTDRFMQEEFLPFYKRVSDAFEQNHPMIFSGISSFFSGKKTLIGMRLMDNDCLLGDYTLHLEGAKITHLENRVLLSEISTPFGVIKPYAILEKRTIEKMIQDEPDFIEHPFATKLKYMHDTTIKFLK